MPDHRKNDEGSNRQQGQDVGHEYRRVRILRLQVREWARRQLAVGRILAAKTKFDAVYHARILKLR